MTIAELFVKIGFQVENQSGFNNAMSQLGFGEVKAINLKNAVLGAGAALSGLMVYASNAAIGLYRFRVETGESTDELQQWQYAAAGSNVAAKDVTDAVKSIQQAQAQIALGEGNISPWALLGIDPRQDPLKVLWQIHQRIQTMAPATARLITGQLGISEDMFVFLKQANISIGELQQKYIVTKQAQDELFKSTGQLRQIWQELAPTLVNFAAQISAILRTHEKDIERVISKLADWMTRLASDTPQGERWRENLKSTTNVILELAAALTALTAALKLYATASVAKTVIGGIARAIGAAGAGATGETIASAGGGAIAKAGTASFAEFLELLAPAAYAFGSFYTVLKGHVREVYEGMTPYGGPFAAGKIGVPAAAYPRSSVTQHNDIDIHVTGSSDPKATGDAAARTARRVLDDQTSSFFDQNALISY